MATKKKTISIKKPTLVKTMSFAKGKKPSKSGLVPDGDTRLVCNVRTNLHRKLKHAAVDEGTTIGQIVERLIDKHL